MVYTFVKTLQILLLKSVLFIVSYTSISYLK